MNAKKWIITAAVVSAVGIGAVSAQEGRPPQDGREGPIRAAVEAAADETGLEAREILVQMRDGMSLAEVVTANGGDVQAVIDQAVEVATDRIEQAVENGRFTQEQADERLNNLTTLITEGVNAEFPDRVRPMELVRNGQQILLQSAADATGLSAEEIRPMLRDGVTLADVIEANGGDVQAVVADAVADATARIGEAVTSGELTQERADELTANLETLFTNAINNTLRERSVEEQAGLGVLELVTEQTGLEQREILDQLRGGTTLGEVLAANGVDLNAFVDAAAVRAETRLDEAVANGRMTQERADELLSSLRERLTERLNSSNPL